MKIAQFRDNIIKQGKNVKKSNRTVKTLRGTGCSLRRIFLTAVLALTAAASSQAQNITAGGTQMPSVQAALTTQYNRIDARSFPRIVSYVTVSDSNGNTLGGLTESNFEVREDGTRELPIEVVELRDDSIGVSVVLVIDRSTSMRNQPIEDARNAAMTFVDLMNSKDQAAVVSFASDVRTDHGFSQDKDSLKAAISKIQAKGGTAIYDALVHTANLIEPVPGRKAIILLTDGHDKDSQNTYESAMNVVVPINVPVFTIGLKVGSEEEVVLQNIARDTGGQYYRSPKSNDLEEIYKTISALLHHQYRITYTTHNDTRDGTRRLVQIDAMALNSSSRDTASYRAPLDITTFALATRDVPVPGRSFMLDVAIPRDSLEVFGMKKLTFTISYPTALMDVKQPAAQAIFAGRLWGASDSYTLAADIDETAGTVTLTLEKKDGADTITGTGLVAHLTFSLDSTLQDGQALAFRFSGLQAWNGDGVALKTQTRDLVVNVYGVLTLAAATKQQCSPGKPFTLLVEFPKDAKALPGMRTVNFVLSYPRQYLTPKQPVEVAVQGGTLLGGADEYNLKIDDKGSEGKLVIDLAQKSTYPLIAGQGELLRVQFDVSPDLPDSTVLTFALQEIFAHNDAGWQLPVRPRNLTLASYGMIVWPGDTDGNGSVELRDVNMLGVYWNISGPGRPDEQDPVAWKGQFSGRYPAPQAAHADADGSGRITELDLVPIAVNWGRTRGQGAAKSAAARPASGDVRLEMEPVENGAQRRVRIFLQSEAPENVRGVALRIKLGDARLISKSPRPGSFWTETPLLVAEPVEAGGVLAVCAMLPADVTHVGAEGGTVFEFEVSTDAAAPVLKMESAALISADGTVWPVENRDSNTGSLTPGQFQLLPAYPNPFNPSTRISWQVPGPARVHVAVFDATGRLVYETEEQAAQAGISGWTWNGLNLAGDRAGSGTYFVRVSAFSADGVRWQGRQKIILLK